MFTDLRGGVAEERANPLSSAARNRPIAFVELITTAALALSTAVAITAVSIGIARADVAGAVVGSKSGSFAFVLAIVLLLSGMGGLSALMAVKRRRSRVNA